MFILTFILNIELYFNLLYRMSGKIVLILNQFLV